MKFWDSSALSAVIAVESSTVGVRKLLDEDDKIAIWWATTVEIHSSINRKFREGQLDSLARSGALALWQTIAATATEVVPTEEVCRDAERLIEPHDLRAADALQLAAYLTASGGKTKTLDFVCLDARLRSAAAKEGATVLP